MVNFNASIWSKNSNLMAYDSITVLADSHDKVLEILKKQGWLKNRGIKKTLIISDGIDEYNYNIWHNNITLNFFVRI